MVITVNKELLKLLKENPNLPVYAYVDAEMSSFDITRDLTMKVHPTIIQEKYSAMRASGLSSTSYGLQCSFSF